MAQQPGGLISISALLSQWRAAAAQPSVLIDTLLAEAAAGDAQRHIYIQLTADRARSRAQDCDVICARGAPPGAGRGALPGAGPLFAVPVAVKDNIEFAGMATSCGSRAFARPPAVRHAAIVNALEAAGAIVLGKTNLDEAALGASGRNPHFGRCANPRGEGLLSGGSSSGSAASVAAGHTLLAIGTDTLGSVRIPAALCGVVGFKPTPGRLAMDGVVPLHPPFDTLGWLVRSLDDAAVAARVLLPAAPARAAPGGPLLCIGSPALDAAAPGIAEDYRRCLEALRASANFTLRDCPAFDFEGVSRAALWEVAHAFAADSGFALPGRAAPGAELLELLERAATLPWDRLQRGRAMIHEGARQLRATLSSAQALLTPTCPVGALAAADALPRSIAAFVAPANLAGLPAVAWPQAMGGSRVLSLQLIGRAGDDVRLLELAGGIQRALGRSGLVAPDGP